MTDQEIIESADRAAREAVRGISADLARVPDEKKVTAFGYAAARAFAIIAVAAWDGPPDVRQRRILASEINAHCDLAAAELAARNAK